MQAVRDGASTVTLRLAFGYAGRSRMRGKKHAGRVICRKCCPQGSHGRWLNSDYLAYFQSVSVRLLGYPTLPPGVRSFPYYSFARGVTLEPALAVIGLNYRTSPVSVRERFWISEPRRYEALHQLVGSEGIEEAILVTCNRTEFILWANESPPRPIRCCGFSRMNFS